MIKFPIVDIKNIKSEQVSIIKYLFDYIEHEKCLLLCPCLSDDQNEFFIGSYYCKFNCPYTRGRNESKQLIYCSHKYWIKELEREFYKYHGDRNF